MGKLIAGHFDIRVTKVSNELPKLPPIRVFWPLNLKIYNNTLKIDKRYRGHVSNRNRQESCMVLIVGEIAPKPWYKFLKVLLNDYVMHVLSNFSQNMNLTLLGSVSLEMWQSKVCFESLVIFVRYFWAEKMEKQIRVFINL